MLKKFRKYIRPLQIIIGLILVMYSSQSGRANFHLIVYGREASGTIVDYKQDHWVVSDKNQSKSSDPFMPVVEFHTKNQIVRFQDSVGSDSADEINKEVKVLYDSDRPGTAIIKRSIRNWMPWAPMLVIGLILLMAAFGKSTEEKKKQE
jgi:hypothetical protein